MLLHNLNVQNLWSIIHWKWESLDIISMFNTQLHLDGRFPEDPIHVNKVLTEGRRRYLNWRLAHHVDLEMVRTWSQEQRLRVLAGTAPSTIVQQNVDVQTFVQILFSKQDRIPAMTVTSFQRVQHYKETAIVLSGCPVLVSILQYQFNVPKCKYASRFSWSSPRARLSLVACEMSSCVALDWGSVAVEAAGRWADDKDEGALLRTIVSVTSVALQWKNGWLLASLLFCSIVSC